MKLIEQLRANLKAIGATLDDRAEGFVVCDAPSGYVWTANGEPSLTINFANYGGQRWLAEAMRYEGKNLAMGLDKVTDKKKLADHRWNLGDDDWGAPTDAPDRIEWPSNVKKGKV